MRWRSLEVESVEYLFPWRVKFQQISPFFYSQILFPIRQKTGTKRHAYSVGDVNELSSQGSQPWVFAGRIGDNQQTQLWSPNCTISIHVLSCFWLR